MQKIIEIEQHLLFFIDFIRVPKYRVRPIVIHKLDDAKDTCACLCVYVCIFLCVFVCVDVTVFRV